MVAMIAVATSTVWVVAEKWIRSLVDLRGDGSCIERCSRALVNR